MRRALSGAKIGCDISAKVTNVMAAIPSRDASGSVGLKYSRSLNSGTGSGQADRGWEYAGTLLDGQSLVIDLFDFAGIDLGAGDGKDIVGQDLSPMESIAAIVVMNENAINDAGALEVLPDASNGWSPVGTHTVANGGALTGQGALFKAKPGYPGFDVIDASRHRLKLTANGGAVDYRVVLLGRHSDLSSSSSSSGPPASSSSSSSSGV